MGTLTITATGFANLPATPPANWPVGITWPGSGNPNGTKSYTVNDADWLRLLTWTASSTITPNTQTPPTPTAAQILLNWLQIWINGTQTAVQQYFTAPVVPPPPLTIT